MSDFSLKNLFLQFVITTKDIKNSFVLRSYFKNL